MIRPPFCDCAKVTMALDLARVPHINRTQLHAKRWCHRLYDRVLTDPGAHSGVPKDGSDVAACRGTGCRRTAAKTGTASGARSAGAAARIPSPAERIAGRYPPIVRTGHQRADAAAGREQSGAAAFAGPNRTGPSRTAERCQARNRARPK